MRLILMFIVAFMVQVNSQIVTQQSISTDAPTIDVTGSVNEKKLPEPLPVVTQLGIMGEKMRTEKPIEATHKTLLTKQKPILENSSIENENDHNEKNFRAAPLIYGKTIQVQSDIPYSQPSCKCYCAPPSPCAQGLNYAPPPPPLPHPSGEAYSAPTAYQLPVHAINAYSPPKVISPTHGYIPSQAYTPQNEYAPPKAAPPPQFYAPEKADYDEYKPQLHAPHPASAYVAPPTASLIPYALVHQNPPKEAYFYRSANEDDNDLEEEEDSVAEEAKSAAYELPKPIYSTPKYSYTYSSPAPQVNCGKNLLIGCAPTVDESPCSPYNVPSSY